jgi:lysine 6-dehydrogenase
MKYAVLGAGLMGRAAAYDLLRHDDTELVILADSSRMALANANIFLKSKKIKLQTFDASNVTQVEKIFGRVDAAIAAVHYGFNLNFTKAAIKTKTYFCDMGGNSAIVDKQLALSAKAQKAGIIVIPDCGLAPGMVSLFARWGIEKFPWVDSVKIRVGGLPQKPTGALNYERLFSVEGLINEYIEPVRIIRDGKIKTIEPLSETESLEFPAPYGTLEAFTTSGGTSTLVDTYRNRLNNLDYKTIRYPGHCVAIRSMYELGYFAAKPVSTKSGKIVPRHLSRALFENNIPVCQNDVTLMRVIFEGSGNKHEITIIDQATEKPHLTAMMRTTAFPAAIISWMQAHGYIAAVGVLPQELCVPIEPFIAELQKRGVTIQGV